MLQLSLGLTTPHCPETWWWLKTMWQLLMPQQCYCRYQVPLAPHTRLQCSPMGKRIFSKVYLLCCYHQIPVTLADIPMITVITPFGLWEFLCMPFGLKNAAQAFQTLMDGILHDLNFIFVCMNDILIGSYTNHEHEAHFHEIFCLLSNSGMVINHKRKLFGANKLTYLGQRVTTTSIMPLESRVTAVSDFPMPTNQVSLQHFLGMINY